MYTVISNYRTHNHLELPHTQSVIPNDRREEASGQA